MTWEELKLAIQVIYSTYVGSGKLIDDTDNGTTPSSLAILAYLACNRITNYPVEFDCLKVTSTISLTGASSYDLKTLFPDLKSVYQIYGINENQDVIYFSNKEGNITPIDGCTIKGDTLIFTGVSPTGTATIQYKSKYAVKTVADVRQKYFLADTDYTVFDDENLIVFGIGEFINWYTDSKEQDRKAEVHNWFLEAKNNLILHNKNTAQISSFL